MTRRLLFILLVLPSFAFAQKFDVRGTLVDSLSNPLPSATLMLLNAKDSSLVTFGMSDKNGVFAMKSILHGKYILKVTFVGYATYTRSIAPEPGALVVDLGRVKIESKSTQLGEVVVKGEVIPVVVKHDTIEFNAAAFKTKANANVEDLLKKLPGIDVESDGTVRAQGEQVQRVTVGWQRIFRPRPQAGNKESSRRRSR
ncbi:MAG: carboxypeptidase regulatory-like domain-containing protein [Bacteroidota bacterium]